jgi:hypothetical protein
MSDHTRDTRLIGELSRKVDSKFTNGIPKTEGHGNV